MSNRLPYTPNGKIRQAIRQVWLRSRERAARLKMDKYTCQVCGKKQSKAKGREVAVHVHHLTPIDWDGLAADIRARVLHDPSKLQTLCEACHKAAHEKPCIGRPDVRPCACDG